MFQTKEVNYEFRRRYSVVHQPNRRDDSKICAKHQVEIDGAWCIVLPADADAVMTNAARDLEEYFETKGDKGTVLLCAYKALHK